MPAKELTAKWDAEHQCPAMPVQGLQSGLMSTTDPSGPVNAGSVCCQCTQHWTTDVCPFNSYYSTSFLELRYLEQPTAVGTQSRLTWWDPEIKRCLWFPDVRGAHGTTLLVPAAGKQIWNGGDVAEPYSYHQITSNRGGEWSFIS